MIKVLQLISITYSYVSSSPPTSPLVHRLPLSAPDPAQNHVSNDLDKRIAEEREDTLLHVKTQASALRENATDLDEALSEVETFVATIRNCAVEVGCQATHISFNDFTDFKCVFLFSKSLVTSISALLVQSKKKSHHQFCTLRLLDVL